jgi:Bacterial Ig-like domain (group 3)
MKRPGGCSSVRKRAVAAAGAVLVLVVATAAVASSAVATSNGQSKSWTIATSPSPPGMVTNQLNAVSCPAAGTCVAVGESSTAGGSSVLIDTLRADAWSLATPPDGPGPYMNVLEGVSCPSTSFCVAVGYSEARGGPQQALVETLSAGSWTVTPSPDNGAGNNELAGVSCSTTSACVAVGSYQSASTNKALVATLVGGSWQLAPAPDEGTGNNLLTAVSCSSSTVCTAVGYYTGSGGVPRALIEDLTGGGWAASAGANEGQGANELDSVSCPSASSCVAVGTYNSAPGVYQALVDTFTAGTWTVVSPSPDAVGVKTNAFSAVSCASSTSCFAVGHYSNGGKAVTLTARLADGAWAMVEAPNSGTSTNELAGVSCVATGAPQCVTVGYFNGVNNSQTLTESWAGTYWHIVASANAQAPYDALTGVSCSSAGNCVAVGSYFNAGGDREELIEQLNGGSWVTASGPHPSLTTNLLNDVSCATPTSCVAVGYYVSGSADQALAETLSGATWALSPVGDEGPGGNELNGVSCPAAGSCVAVGFYAQGANRKALIETLYNGSWTVNPSPDPSPTDNYLESVSCTSTTSCVAVGYDFEANARHTLIEALVNGSWAVVPSIDRGTADNLLDGVSCSSPTSCVAVGYYLTGAPAGGAHLALIETLSGHTWSLSSVPSPSASGDYPAAVSCPQYGSCTVVGSYASGPGGAVAQTLVESLSNGTWVLTPSPGPSPEGGALGGVACVALASCVAVGHYNDGATQASLVETGPAPQSVVPTSTTLSSSPNPAKVGQQVTYTATVVPPPPGGTVTFADNGAVIAGCQAVRVKATSGKATCSFKYRSAGEQLLQAAFSGHSGFTPSTSALYTQMVAQPPPAAQGYWLATKTGGVFAVGSARSLGGISTPASDPMVGIAATADGKGYWVVTANGTVASFGDARSHGDLPGAGVKVPDIVAIAPTANGKGYWLVGRDGGLFAFGNASFHGSVPGVKKGVSNIVGIATSATGGGYLLVGSDGSVFAFGTSRFYGSLPDDHVHVNDIRAILAAPGGKGYVLVGSDGGAFIFGNGVDFHGSLPAERTNVDDIVGIALTPDGNGYFMAGGNGSVYGFGDAKAQPTPTGLATHLPVVAIAGT